MNEETKKQSPEPVLPETSKCKYCKQEIPREASKCHRCGEYQNKLRILVFFPYVIPSVIVLISIAQVLVGYNQMREAHKKYIDASEALKKAEKAENLADSASKNVERASVEANEKVSEIRNILDETKMKLTELNRSIEDGNRAVVELKLLTQFDTVVLNAQNDDRDAFDQLRVWAKDISFPFEHTATQTVEKILEESRTYYLLFKPTVEIHWKEDPNKLTLPQLWEVYKKDAPRKNRLAIVRYVWEKRGDISKKERLQFLADVLKEDKSLEVCRLAGHYFGEGTSDGLRPLNYKEHLEWWEKNKETIK
jgi:hypothetical protein